MNVVKKLRNIVNIIRFCDFHTKDSQLLSKKRIPTTDELKKQRFKKLGVKTGYTPVAADRSFLLKYLPNPEDLPPRSIRDSFEVGIIPLSSNLELQDKYVTFLGRVRIGRLLEAMDLFAVHVGYEHIFAPTVPSDVASPFILVTARCEHMEFTSFERKHNEDIKLSGFVSWVGKSSMEIVVWLEQHSNGKWFKITRGLFLLAARNATATKAAPVNPLKPLNDAENRIIQNGEARKEKRKKTLDANIDKTLPTPEEQRLIHDLYLRTRDTGYNVRTDTRKFPRDLVAMENCRVSNVIFCQPEDRNFYNTIFGGFIMRHATELAWVLAFQFVRHRPHMHHISSVEFLSPIPVKSLMHMNARITYTYENFIQVWVEVFSTDPVEGKSDTSNTFHFTLTAKQPVVHVYPKTYHEAMLYIDGKRQLDLVLERMRRVEEDVMDEYKTKLSLDSE